MFKKLRILILLIVLASVAMAAWQAKSRAAEWQYPLHMAIYPINGDGQAQTSRFIANLKADDFQDIEAFIIEEAERYGVKMVYGAPVEVELAPEVRANPPEPPPNGDVLRVIVWSLRLRFWAWRHDEVSGAPPHIRMFVRYFDPARTPQLQHSLGLSKGMLGVVNAFAREDEVGTNNVVIAHELLHTLGATDKYDPRSTAPIFPEGYAEPERNPRYPQSFAELMGARIPISEGQAEIPPSLQQVLVGERTALEINWIQPQ